MEKPAEYYDELFSSSDDYQSHYKNSFYIVHWTQVVQFLKKIKNPLVLEIGCGPGQLAHLLHDEGYLGYSGFDLSKVAIEGAKTLVPSGHFWVGNALEEENYKKYDYNTVICLEVLEHIKEDLKVIQNIKPGTTIIFSIPNFDAESHVRWFTSERQIKSRYYKTIDIQNIVRVGNIYICMGVRGTFRPNLLQSFLKSREDISLNSFIARLKHRLKNLTKSKKL